MSTRRIRRALVALGLAALAMLALRVYGGWRRATLDPARPLVALPPALDLPTLGGEGARLDVPIEHYYDSLPWRARGEGCAWLAERAGVPFAERTDDAPRPIEHCLVERFTRGALRIRDGAWRHGASEPRMRVQTYGGSVVGGYADARRGTTSSWPALLAERLAADPAWPPTEVASFALGGATSGPELWMFEQIGRREHPDAVILQMGENDLAKCTTFPAEPGRRLDEVLGGGATSRLAELGPWFAKLEERVEAERARRARERAESEAWLVAALRDPESVRAKEPILHDAVLQMAALPWVSEAPTRDPPEPPIQDPRWEPLVERAQVLRRWSAAERANQAALADPALGGAPVDAGRVATSFARDVPLEVARDSELLRNLDRFMRLAREAGAARVLVLPVIEHRAHRGAPVDCEWTLFDQSDWMAYFDGPLREALRALATEHDAAVVDLPALLAARPDPAELFVDTVHMTGEGLELLADAVEEALREVAPARGALGAGSGGRS